MSGTWSTFLTSPSGAYSTPPHPQSASGGVPSYSTHSSPVPRHMHSSQSFTHHPYDRTSSRARAMSTSTPTQSRLKRARDVDSSGTTAGATDDDSSMDDSIRPHIPQLLRAHSDERGLNEDRADQAKSSKRQACHLSVKVDPTNAIHSAQNSPFLHHLPLPVAPHHHPSTSLPSSLSVSPAMFGMPPPMNFIQQQHNSSFSSVSSTPAPHLTEPNPLAFQLTPARVDWMANSQQQMQHPSPHAPIQTIQSTYVQTVQPVPLTAFSFQSKNPNFTSLDSSLSAFRALENLPAQSRPMQSILMQSFETPMDEVGMREERSASPQCSPPSSPVDATRGPYEYVQRPTTPSRTPVSPTSAYSIPALLRVRSNGGGGGHDDATSLQSSLPTSPAPYGLVSGFRSSSPSDQHTASTTTSNSTHSLSTQPLNHFASSLHTPTSSPLMNGGEQVPGIEIGIGVLFMDRCQPSTIAGVSPVTHKRTVTAHQLSQFPPPPQSTNFTISASTFSPSGADQMEE